MSGDPLPPLRDVIKACGLVARKSLGQNFLLDLNITRKIARQVPDLTSSTVIEIGPGPGGLTRSLLMEGAKKVIAIERDERTRPALEAIQEAYPDRFDFHFANALEVDEKEFIPGNGPVQIAANLPYNVASPLLAKWLETEPWPPWFTSLTVMLQKEMAGRLVAQPGTKTYGRLSVLAQWRSRPKVLFHLPPDAFTPKPKITSSVTQVFPGAPGVDGLDGKTVGVFTSKLFGKRRKTVKNNLAGLGENAVDILKKEKIDPGLRPENLTVLEIARLAKVFRASL